MKIRNGFVSNSSSSSFTCEVCGEEVGGWDCSLSEVEMSECVNSHVFCNEHMNKEEEPDIDTLQKFCLSNIADEDKEKRCEILKMDYEELADEAESWDYDSDDPYDVTESKCPICSFDNVNKHEAYRFLLKRVGLTEEQFLQEIKDKFKNYAEFIKEIE